MDIVALQRSRLAGILSALSLDDMSWAVKFLKEKISLRSDGVSRIDTSRCKSETERERTKRFLTSVCGTWDDDKDVDEMVREIYESRVDKKSVDIEKMFD